MNQQHVAVKILEFVKPVNPSDTNVTNWINASSPLGCKIKRYQHYKRYIIMPGGYTTETLCQPGEL